MVLEQAPEVGGTWWYNRYPGCMSDTESHVYRLFWDKQDLQTYPWSSRYVQAPEILEYLRHLVEKHDMRKHIRLNTQVVDATWDNETAVWTMATNHGETYTGRYLVTALGALHKPVFPDIPGIKDFNGTLIHSSEWDPAIKLSGKRVGVVGCGATGVQIISAIAPHVGSLVSFQRSPQYSVPAGNRPIPPSQRAWINVHYDEIVDKVWKSSTGFGFEESKRPAMSVSRDDRQRIFEDLWQIGQGMHFMFGGFGDLTTDPEANEEACEFMRSKIRQIVKDPEKAGKLMPREPFARRPLCDSGYYEAFNRDNVNIVSCAQNPIAAITRDGIRMTDGATYDLYMIIFATGFDTVDGAYTCFPIRGRGGKLLTDHWREGGKSYLGISCAGFPNMFIINGPLAPFGNNAATMQCVARPITRLIQEAERRRGEKGTRSCAIEAVSEAETQWNATCQDIAKGSMFRLTKSWLFGGNVDGKPVGCRVFLGGLSMYDDVVEDVMSNGYGGFTISV